MAKGAVSGMHSQAAACRQAGKGDRHNKAVHACSYHPHPFHPRCSQCLHRLLVGLLSCSKHASDALGAQAKQRRATGGGVGSEVAGVKAVQPGPEAIRAGVLRAPGRFKGVLMARREGLR